MRIRKHIATGLISVLSGITALGIGLKIHERYNDTGNRSKNAEIQRLHNNPGVTPLDEDEKKDPKKVEYFNKYSRMSHDEVIEEIKTPKQAVDYLKHYLKYMKDQANYGNDDYHASFKEIHRRRRDDCDGYAFAAGALLEDDGYPATMLHLENDSETRGHMVFLYKEKGLYGCINVDTIVTPQYQTVEDLVRGLGYDGYAEFNPSGTYSDWVTSTKNMADAWENKKIEKVKNIQGFLPEIVIKALKEIKVSK